MTADNMTKAAAFDPLDMGNYKVEKLPKMQKSKFEVWMARLGGPLAIAAFVWICWFCHIGFIDNLDTSLLASTAQKRLDALGLAGFIRANYAMLAIFVASLILWMTEALPNYLTSLILILLVVLFNVTTQKEALAQLGHPVMWLNILSFVLASMLVKTQFAKRLALAFVIKFGKSAKGVLWSFLVINLVLSAFISATTVKATIMLPIFMVICAIYGASGGHRKRSCSRSSWSSAPSTALPAATATTSAATSSSRTCSRSTSARTPSIRAPARTCWPFPSSPASWAPATSATRSGWWPSGRCR